MRKHSDSNAATHGDLFAREANRLRRDAAEVSGDLVGPLGAGDVRDHGDELVAAHTRDAVQLARIRAQPVGDRFEHRVTGGVAQPVVYVLEPVDIDEEHGRHPLLPARVLDRHRQAVVQQRAIRHSSAGSAPFTAVKLFAYCELKYTSNWRCATGSGSSTANGGPASAGTGSNAIASATTVSAVRAAS